MPLSPTHTPQEIQNHLYQSFLQGTTTDVTVQIKAKNWSAAYDLHRVVIIQAVSSSSEAVQSKTSLMLDLAGILPITVYQWFP